MHILLLFCKRCLLYGTLAFLFLVFLQVNRPASKSNCPHSVLLLSTDKSCKLGDILQYTSNLLPYKHPSNLLPFLMAHCAAIGLNTCLQLLNRKKPTEEIDSTEMEKS